jgi:hypothetical protein
MFKSPSTTSNGDYAYIKYQDFSGATTNAGLLTIGVENDPTNASVADKISLYAAGGLGFVGVNTLNPQFPLDVSGATNINGSLSVVNGSITVNGSPVLTTNAATSGISLIPQGLRIGTSTNYYVSFNKPNFYNDPSLVIYYNFDTSINNGNTVQNMANPGIFDGSLNNNGAVSTGMIDRFLYKYGAASLRNNSISNNGMKILSGGSTIPISQTMTFSLWVNITNAPPASGYRIFEFTDHTLPGQSTESNTIALDISANGYVYPTLTSTSAPCITTLNAPIVPYDLRNTGWNHIVWTLTPSISTIYVNTAIKQVDTITTPVPGTSRNNANIAYSF